MAGFRLRGEPEIALTRDVCRAVPPAPRLDQPSPTEPWLRGGRGHCSQRPPLPRGSAPREGCPSGGGSPAMGAPAPGTPRGLKQPSGAGNAGLLLAFQSTIKSFQLVRSGDLRGGEKSVFSLPGSPVSCNLSCLNSYNASCKSY